MKSSHSNKFINDVANKYYSKNINLIVNRYALQKPLKIIKNNNNNNNFFNNSANRIKENFNNNNNNKFYNSNNINNLLNNLRKEIVEIGKNIKDTDNKVEYYIKKNYSAEQINNSNYNNNIDDEKLF